MLDIGYIRENPKKVKKGSKDKGYKVDVDHILELDEKYRNALQDTESLRAKRNEISTKLSRDMDSNTREKHLKEAEGIKRDLKDSESFLKEVLEELDKAMRKVPNMPFDDVPVGKDDSENVVLRYEGEKPKFDFKAKDYLDIAEQWDLIDMERAAKVAGSRFGYLKNQVAQLEFALVRFAMDMLTEEGFSPVVPPVLIRSEFMRKLGYLDTREDEDEIYYLEKDDMYLVGTSEQSIVPMHADETLNEKDLPLRYAGFSTCFRREAGSYGKDTRGILRVHQFDKIEMVSFSHPERSRDEHKFLLSMQEKLMKALEVPYQVVHICTGDTGFPMAEKFDIESWIPSEDKYRETHSTSNATDFQARRLNTRFKGKDKGYVHILNGTAFAIGRTLIAIIENHQNEDGTVTVPKALQKYTGFKRIGS
ncbi:MAG: serine--tRNA ligase [Candidatus Spechtbacterales bacterium]|nr:serine--tRNA ligase [Candidatus Spechtbacterales bacterium]